VAAYLRGEGSLSELAEHYDLSIPTLHQWVMRASKTGVLAPRTSPGRPRKLADPALARLRDLVAEDNDATLPALAEAMARREGVLVSRQTIGRALQHLDVTRKKSRSMRRNVATSVSPVYAAGSAHASRTSMRKG
jgi:transposase